MKKIALLLLFSLQCLANSFPYDLYSKLAEEKGNLAFSPYGISSNLSLLYFGANGETASEIKKVLHLEQSDKQLQRSIHKELTGLTLKSPKGYQLYIANALFPHEGVRFLPSFEQIGAQVFEAELETIDFSKPARAAEIVNKWISSKTLEKIPHLLTESDVDGSTRLILANAIYFHGDWVFPFEASATQPGFFRAPDQHNLEVEMLKQLHRFSYFENEIVQGVSLPFARQSEVQPALECLILLPRVDIADLEKHFDEKTLSGWLKKGTQTLLNLQIPKFCIRKRIALNAPLRALGMALPFSYRADFSKINGGTDLFLSSVLHETYFSFKENGVTAAAATTSQISMKSVLIPSAPITQFIADRPFIFLILDTESKSILFMGRVTHPTGEKCDEN